MSIFSKLSYVSRVRKLERFNKLFSPSFQTKILDVGAEINPKGDLDLQLIDSFPWKENITAVNLSKEHVRYIEKIYPEIDSHVADACKLPWPDDHFDIVYSNAVIEHVGDFEKQKQMASEIMRVGKKWFITTPNRWYPFEFHLRLPFVTWFPGKAYVGVGKIIRFNHVRKNYQLFSGCTEQLRLLTARELKQCFPGSEIIKQRVTFMPETLIAVGSKYQILEVK